MENSRRPYLSTLTPLRGIAALFVVLFHSSNFFGSFIPTTATLFFENGWLWVDFFFILSGFILSFSYDGYFKNRVTASAYKNYLAARFARIYPLYFFTMLWAFAVAACIVYWSVSIDKNIADLFNLKALLPCLLLIQDLHIFTSSPLNFASWSLSAEWWVYVLFPFLVPHFVRFTTIKKVAMLLIVVFTYLAIRFILGPVSINSPNGSPTVNVVADFGLVRCFAGFTCGMLLFAFYDCRSGQKLFKNSWSFTIIFTTIVIFMHANITDLLIIALFPFLLLAAAYNETGIKKLLETKILQQLGKWSFSIYLVHPPVILMLIAYSVYKDRDLLSNITMAANTEEPNYLISLIYCVITTSLTLAISAFTYRFIELPAGSFLKKALAAKMKFKGKLMPVKDCT